MRRYVYRIKTKEEFLSGIHNSKHALCRRGSEYWWRSKCFLEPTGAMDYLLGAYVEVPGGCIDEDMNVNERFSIKAETQSSIGYWTIHPSMLVREDARALKIQKIASSMKSRKENANVI